MIQTLSQLISSATALAAGRADYSLSEASYWCNVAYQEVAQAIGHRGTEALAVSSTTSGEGRYSVPADYDAGLAWTLYRPSSATTGSRQTTAIALTARDVNWADSRSLPDRGVPESYVNFNGYVELYPSPNSAYSLQLRYVAKVAALVASTDTVQLDDRWHPAIAFKTAEYLAAARNDAEGEALARNRYLNYISVIPSDQQLRQRDKGSMSMRFTGFNRSH